MMGYRVSTLGDDGGGEDDEEKQPSCGDYVMHFITLFWKLLFAFVPPTELARGYVCFIVSIFAIGVVTAVIGDIASHFGCTLGIRDSVTAIVFVALGTSIPGFFYPLPHLLAVCLFHISSEWRGKSWDFKSPSQH
uniref:Sodium/calcium exchanger membrane region domain-containing protein n=1 Tax=Timema douglasi TaxID=61478 RepID=A0A7R8VK30_TIMDO|nr:unnamed protein product [Timema douglasi]